MNTTLFQYGKVTKNGNAPVVEVIRTGNAHFDEWVSRFGGFVRGTWMFLTGTAGAGKTTLILFLQSLCKDYKTILWSLEMSAEAVERQCNKYKVQHGNAFIADSDSCPTFEGFMEMLEREKPDIIAIDSIQMVAKLLLDRMGMDEAVNHVKDVLRKFNEKNNSVLVFIGQMNKDGTFRGPQEILQLADAHMEMTYYRDSNERVISWGGKNRNGDDPSATLFYRFGEGEMKFYTPTEWEIEKHKLTFAGFMMKAATNYLMAMKSREGYAEVRKTLKQTEALMNKQNLTEDERFLRMAKAINDAVTAAWPVVA